MISNILQLTKKKLESETPENDSKHHKIYNHMQWKSGERKKVQFTASFYSDDWRNTETFQSENVFLSYIYYLNFLMEF